MRCPRGSTPPSTSFGDDAGQVPQLNLGGFGGGSRGDVSSRSSVTTRENQFVRPILQSGLGAAFTRVRASASWVERADLKVGGIRHALGDDA